jgi:hypothetical protein
MDDVIIIILTLVLTVVAAINQSKKRKQQAPAETGEEPADIWEEILQTGKQKPVPANQGEPVILKEYPKPRRAAEKARTYEVSSRKTKTLDKPASIFNYENEGGRNEDILRSGQIRQSSDASISQEDSGESVLEDFTLRKAVIYAEIINPKYF